MKTKYFVAEDSIVRQIWGNADTILLIFSGTAAEFALNKTVDWLYFTGRLPADPIGRLFSTVSYSKVILFSQEKEALKAIDSISSIHRAVESKRGARLPDRAYRDVLFMLIDYSIRSFEILERPMTLAEKLEVFDVFLRMGTRMGIYGLPDNFEAWGKMREEHLLQNLENSTYTADLFSRYRNHLGIVRYKILLAIQEIIVPVHVRNLLRLNGIPGSQFLIRLYKLSRHIGLARVIKAIILPVRYKQQFKTLDIKKCPFKPFKRAGEILGD